ncbi:hypothetical protein EGW08_021333 [Elysia chlorotica]|uniref:SMB domain-containing protein n=1 Tax=Elysia chlorotica TaxID=188477 RepID=A0A3S0ZMJ6_ELYCH|nr:hypothetical protein EGW08_021333 [Elysia chlorotica]
MNFALGAESPEAPTPPSFRVPQDTSAPTQGEDYNDASATQATVSSTFLPRRGSGLSPEESSSAKKGGELIRQSMETSSGEIELKKASEQAGGRLTHDGKIGVPFLPLESSFMTTTETPTTSDIARELNWGGESKSKPTEAVGLDGATVSINSKTPEDKSSNLGDTNTVGSLRVNSLGSSSLVKHDTDLVTMETRNTQTSKAEAAVSRRRHTTNENLSTKDVEKSIVVNAIDVEPPSLDLKIRDINSCAQRCGEDTNVPCSCDAKCTVHKSCCDDFTETCPEVYAYALRRLGHLMNASVRCDTMTVVFMVESCPKTNPPKRVNGPLGTPTSTVASRESTTADTSGKADFFSRVLANAPITDYSTGIIYANASIYHCNNAPGQGEASANQTVAWNLQIGTGEHQQPVYSMLDINQQLDLTTFSYLPPESQPASAGSLCYNNWTLNCISFASANKGIEQMMCNTTVSKFYGGCCDQLVHFYNDICSECLSSFQMSSGNSFRYYNNGFRVLMSLSERPGQVVYNLDKTMLRWRPPLPWLSWTCDVGEKPANQTAPECRALNCSSEYTVTPSGLCRKKIDAEISIQEQVFHKNKTCNIDAEAFVEAALCYLSELYKIKMTAAPYKTATVRDASSNVSQIVLRMDMFADVESFSVYWEKLTNMQEFLGPAMEVFVRRHCFDDDPFAPELNTGNQENFPIISEKQNTDFDDTEKSEVQLKTNVMEPSMDSSTFYFKHCLQLYFLVPSDTIVCDISGSSIIHLDEKNNDKELPSQVAELTCIKRAQMEFKSDGCKLSPSISFACLFIVGSLIIW